MVVNRQSLREQVKSSLIQSILSSEIAAGERLVELELAERFGVSQAPVREALRELATVGLVTKVPNRGTYAADFASSVMHDIFAVRGALEELATKIATPSLSEDTSDLQEAADAMVAAAERGDAAGVGACSIEFHGLIVDAAKNPVLSQMWRSLNLDVHTTVAVHQQVNHLLALAKSHQPLIDTIASGDIGAACRAARHHQDDLDEITRNHTSSA